MLRSKENGIHPDLILKYEDDFRFSFNEASSFFPSDLDKSLELSSLVLLDFISLILGVSTSLFK